MTVTLWLDTGEEETIELGATLPFYQAWAEIVRAGGDSFAEDYPDLAGVVSQCEDQEDADPDWLKDVRLQAADALKEHGDSLSDRAQAILSLLAGDAEVSGDNPLSPETATFAEEDSFDLGDVSLGGLSREEIAEILIDAALDARDDAEFAAWEESKHPRGQPENKGEFGPGGGGGTKPDALPQTGGKAERLAQRRTRQEQYLARVQEVKKKINPRDAAAVQKLVRDLEKKTALDKNPGVDENALLAAMWRAGIAIGGTGLKQYQLLDRMVFTGLLSKGISGGSFGTPKAITYHLPMRQENRLIDGAHFADAEFYDPNQLRDHRGRWTTGGGSGASQGLPHVERQAQRESAQETVRAFMAGKGSPSLREASGLAKALSTLTVAQIHEVKREHGLKASSPDKAGLVAKLAERFRAAREARPVPEVPEVKPAEAEPVRGEGTITVQPARYAKGQVAVTITSDGSGRKTRAHRLAEHVGGRWSNREHAYIMSPTKAARLQELHAAGRDASPITGELRPAEPKPSEKKPAESKASDLRREAVKSAIGDTYSQYNGTHQLLQDIAAGHDTLAGALAEAERQGLIDTRQRSPQTDVSPLQRDRQGEFVRRVLGQAYGEQEAPKAQPQPQPKPVRDRVPEGTYGPSKARIRYEDDAEREQAETAAKEFFGRLRGTPHDFAGAAGAPNDAEVSLSVDEYSVVITYSGDRDGEYYEGYRTLYKPESAPPYLVNDGFEGKGVGLEMFGRQVEEATRLGVSHIETKAAGQFVPGPDPNKSYGDYNGYITWPKFGYDGPLPEGYSERLPVNLRADVEAAGGNLRGLMASKEGQDWWLHNGSSINLRFDLTPGSYSQRTLAAYLQKRGILK